MSGKDRYDTMIPFFGKPNDKRVRLYLHALESEYEVKKTVQLSDNWNGNANCGIRPELQNVFFTTPNPGSANDKEVHNEWHTFANNLECRLADLTQNGPSSSGASDGAFDSGSGAGASRLTVDTKAILEVIKSKAGQPTNPQLEFFQQVIKAYLLSVKNASNDELKDAPSRWAEATQFTFKNRTGLGAIYGAAGVDGTKAGSNCVDNASIFNYRITKYLLAAFLENTPVVSLGPDSFWSTQDANLDKYFRISSDPKKIFTIDPATGNKIDVTRGSAEFNSKIGNDVCFGTKGIDNPTSKAQGRTCVDYIQKCIVEGKPEDISACKNYMLDTNFWSTVQTEIDEMLPSIAVQTLTNFGFQIDRRNKKYASFEGVNSWLRGLEARTKLPTPQLTSDELNNIAGNIKLTQYLTMLVNKVNQNPAILNENYFNSNVFDISDQEHRFAGWTPYPGMKSRIMIKTNFPADIARQTTFISNNFIRFRNNIQRKLAIIPGVGLSVYGTPYHGVLPFMMVGGSSEDEIFQKQGDQLEKLIEVTVHNLKSSGKTLDADTEMQIKKHIAQYKDSENKLVKAITYADKYIQLTQLFKENDTQNVLNMDYLKSFVEARDKYFDKTETRQHSIISLIQNIGDQILDKLNDEPYEVNFSSKASISRNN